MSAAKMRNCIILGSGRSGTSMVAGALHASGYHMGDELLPASSSNPKGYFEDRVVNEVNEDLLGQVVPVKPSGRRGRLYPRGMAYGHRWLAALAPGPVIKVTPEIASRIRWLTRLEPFCFKDPRFCYTLDLWRPALGQVVFLCVFREPGRTAASIITDCHEQQYLKHVRMSRRRALRIWTAMYRNVLDTHSRHGRWEFVHYDQFLDGSAIPRLEAALAAQIDTGFVDARLKRAEGSAVVSRDANSIYDRLCSLAHFEQSSRHQRPGRASSERVERATTC